MSLHQCNDLNSHHKSPLLPCKKGNWYTDILKKTVSLFIAIFRCIYICLYVRVISNKVLVFLQD